MRLDATDLRYVTQDEFRVLTATEIGSKNHEVVPSSLIAEISGVRGGNVNKALGSLAKRGLVARVQNQKYYLSLRTFSRRKPPSVASVGKKVGVGKESDIYVVKDEAGESRILKLHRLGRISFRAIKNKRDYLGNRSSASWMFMSRLGAEKEFAFMKALYLHDFPVPVPIDQARHCIVMSLVDSYPLRQINDVPSPSELYAKLMDLILRLAHVGLIHGDFNEFNILIKRKDGEPVVIDFPQMVSIRHENAEYFFNRDVNCIRKFFRKRFRYEAATWPVWKDVLAGLDLSDAESAPSKRAVAAEDGETGREATASGEEERSGEEISPEPSGSRPKPVRLDLEVEASGFSRDLQTQLEIYMNQVQDMPESDYEDDDDDEEEEGEDEQEAEEPTADTANGAEGEATEESFDEDAFQKQMSDRLEALRLHKALGNDDDLDADLSSPADDRLEDEEEEDSDNDSDEDSADSDGPPQSDFTTYTRPPPPHSPRLNVRQPKDDSLRKSIAGKVLKEREASIRGGKGGTGGKTGGLGKRKGQKWKSSAAYAVGKSGGGDGWS